jgi:hypothetical protein
MVKEISRRFGEWWKHISIKKRKSEMTTKSGRQDPQYGDLPPKPTTRKVKGKAKRKVAKEKILHQS